MTGPRRLTFLETLTGCDMVPDYEGFWSVARIPGDPWALTMVFTPEKPKKQVVSIGHRKERITEAHVEYVALLTKGFEKNKGRHWSITFFGGYLTDLLMRTKAAYHEAAHLRLGYGGSAEDELACEDYANAEMKKLFGAKIADEITRRREAGKSCMSIPGLQEVAKRLQGLGQRQAVQDYGLLLQGCLAVRGKR